MSSLPGDGHRPVRLVAYTFSVVLGACCWRQGHLAGFSVLWFYAGLILTSVRPLHILVSEQCLYLSLAGLAFGAVYLLAAMPLPAQPGDPCEAVCATGGADVTAQRGLALDSGTFFAEPDMAMYRPLFGWSAMRSASGSFPGRQLSEQRVGNDAHGPRVVESCAVPTAHVVGCGRSVAHGSAA